MKPPIAITGVGLASPAGCTAGAFWDGLMSGADLRGGWSRGALSSYPGTAVIELPDRVVESVGGLAGSGLANRLADFTVNRALADAGLGADDCRIGCFLATTTAGVDAFAGRIAGAATEAPGMSLDGSAVLASPRVRWRGPASVLSTACSAGLLAPALAADALASGEADAMIAGGIDVLLEYTVCGFAGLRLATDDRCRPFSSERKGVLLSEGAACFCLETLPAALRRRARILGVIVGHGVSCDADHVTAPNPEGVARAMAQALRSSGIGASEIGGIFAHATGTSANDPAELAALCRVFTGERTPPVSAIKSVLGHPQAAAGSFALLAALLALEHGLMPPTAGLAEVDPALRRADVVLREGRPLASTCLMVNAFGFGGNNCVMVVADRATALRLGG